MNLKKKIAAVGAASLGLVGSAMAEVPAGVTTAITGASTDGGTIVAAMAAAGAAVFLLAKILKKFGVFL